MPDKIAVSIITVVYNGERTIEETIKSVISQQYPFIEYIIIDGSSTDRTMDVVEKYRDHISKVISEKDHGIYDAMNKGIGLASGDIVGILNSDDVYADKEVISEVVQAMLSGESVEVVYGNLLIFDQDLKKVFRRWRAGSFHPRFFEKGEMPPHPSFFVRREVYNRYGVFDLELPIAADYELMLRFLRRYQVKSVWIDKVLVHMRTGGASADGMSSIINQNRQALRAWKKNGLKVPLSYLPLRILSRVRQLFLREG